jgi:hypothetical protein
LEQPLLKRPKDEQILRLDIAMNDALFVSRRQSMRNLRIVVGSLSNATGAWRSSCRSVERSSVTSVKIER